MSNYPPQDPGMPFSFRGGPNAGDDTLATHPVKPPKHRDIYHIVVAGHVPLIMERLDEWSSNAFLCKMLLWP